MSKPELGPRKRTVDEILAPTLTKFLPGKAVISFRSEVELTDLTPHTPTPYNLLSCVSTNGHLKNGIFSLVSPAVPREKPFLRISALTVLYLT
jgi:hypothetical protein